MDAETQPDPQPLDPHAVFEHQVTAAISQALQSGASPFVISGLMDSLKLDVHMRLRQAHQEAKRSNIVRSTILPNGRH